MGKDFWRGFGSVLSIFPQDDGRDEFVRKNFNIKPLSYEEGLKADAEAIRKDWEAVGSCFYWAINRIEKNHDDSNNRGE